MTNIYEGGESKNEIAQLRDKLDGNDADNRKAAAKKVISLMRAGDTSIQTLFASMLRCVQTSDMELKKLAYLYLVNFSLQESEQAIMAVGTFVKDSENLNPLIRALAVRTMCRIKLESVAENMIIPLKRCLSDTDPYVRKTAALAVVKLYEIVPEAVENAQLFTDLLNLLRDENPMVVSNTTAAIFEINERRTAPIFNLNQDTMTPILSAISSSSEWCQVNLLDALARYKPTTAEDATFLIDRLVPFLKNNNPAVVIGAFKCIFQFMELDTREPQAIFHQIIPPFITLVTSSEPEVQYVVLRTLSLFVQKFPRALTKEIRVFFCKYNDPSYVKMEKLDIIVTVAGPKSAQLVLDELNEYCNAVDVAFVRKSIKAVGQIAIKIEPASRRCVDILVSLIAGKADYAIEESICVMCDILRKYPGVFESTLADICKSLEFVKEPRARAAGIWILGEYCHLINDVDVLFDAYLDTFSDEQPEVQLQLISALVKLYLERPEDTKDQLQFVLSKSQEPGTAPDVKNRALLYWRLLSTENNAFAKTIVAFPKITTVASLALYEPPVLAELIRNMGMVSGVLHVVPSEFVKRIKFVPEDDQLGGFDGSGGFDNFGSLGGIRSINDGCDDAALRMWKEVALRGDSGQSQNCVRLFVDFDRERMHVRVVNGREGDVGGLAVAVNRNALGLVLDEQPSFPEAIEEGESYETAIRVRFDNSMIADKDRLQIAVRTSEGTLIGSTALPVLSATLSEGDIGAEGFRSQFAALQASATAIVEDATVADADQLAQRNVFVVGVNGAKTYVTFALPPGGARGVFVGELTQDGQRILVGLKGAQPLLFPAIQASAQDLFAKK